MLNKEIAGKLFLNEADNQVLWSNTSKHETFALRCHQNEQKQVSSWFGCISAHDVEDTVHTEGIICAENYYRIFIYRDAPIWEV